MYAIEFSPPMGGFEESFNTFRLGLKWSKCLKPGDTVALLDKRESLIFGYATVERVLVGKLGEIAQECAHENHNQRYLDREGAPGRLIESMMKRYGPHICSIDKKVSVIYLERTNDVSSADNHCGHDDAIRQVQGSLDR